MAVKLPKLTSILLLATAWLTLHTCVYGQQETIVHSFGDGSVANDGTVPLAPLILGSDGNFYGTTKTGGTAGQGCVFKMTPSGTVTILHSFGDGSAVQDGAQPATALLQGLDGNFYGTTEEGGSTVGSGTYYGLGTIFKMTPQGAVTILHNFGDGTVAADGELPGSTNFAVGSTNFLLSGGALIQGPDGTLYGTTYYGGVSFGVAFKLTTQGTYSILHEFGDGSVASDGDYPVSALTLAADGSLYGTTPFGGINDYGTAFKITSQGVYSILKSGVGQPVGYLTQGSDGNFYGQYSTQNGAIYLLKPGGQLTLLYSFQFSNDISSPVGGLIQASDGNFYGLASTGAFYLSPDGRVVLLHQFGDGSVAQDGTGPNGNLVQGPDGCFYGTTQAGGSAGLGTVFRIKPSLPRMTSPFSASGSVSLPFSFQVTATDSPTTYAATNLPDGLSINAITGLITGTPTTVQTKAITLTFTNAFGSTTFPLTITVGPLQVPDVTSVLTGYGSVGTNFTYQIQGSNNPTSFSASGLTGTGLSLDPASGIISGTPSATGTFTIGLTATNATGTSTTANLSLQVLAAPPTLSQEYNLLHLFLDGSVPNEGQNPSALIQGFDGDFYGVTRGTGSYDGTLFRMTRQGKTSILYTFPLYAGITTLIQAANGDFILTGGGAVFRYTPSGVFSLIKAFGGLNTIVQASDGNFYGTTRGDGATSGGTFFKMTPSGSVTILRNFNFNQPYSPLIQGADGNFYFTGANGLGSASIYNLSAVYRLTPLGGLTVLHSFNSGTPASDGGEPIGGLVQGPDGNFYGTTTLGGTASKGMVYVITPQGALTILHSFHDGSVSNDGINPSATLLLGKDGNFYGTTDLGGTAGQGTIFQITPQGTETIIHNFGDSSVPHDGLRYDFPFDSTTDYTNGYLPSLIQSTDGNLYGITGAGGVGYGTVYSIQAMLQPSHVPIFTGAAYQASALLAPISFTPKALFGVSGSGVENGNIVRPQPAGFMAELASLVTNIFHPAASVTNWTLDGTLPSFLTFDSTSGTISGTPIQAGTFNFTMTPHNAVGTGAPTTVTLYIDVPPGINSALTASGVAGSPFQYQITAIPVAVSYGAAFLPGWLTADPNSGTISGTPPAAGTYVFDAFAATLAGQAVQPVILTVTGGSSSAPTITSPATAAASVGASFSYTITTNPAATSFTAFTLPTGLLFDASSGTILGTPTATGVFHVPITATDASGSYASILTLTIAPPAGPVLASTLAVTAAQGSPFSYVIPASGSVTSYDENGALPPGLTFNSTTGVISGTPTTSGTFPITVTASNSSGSSMASLNLVVGTFTQYSDWASDHHVVGGSTDKPQGDGVPNLLKYVFNINPSAPMSARDRAGLPTVGSISSGGNTVLTLTYRQYALQTGTAVTVQTSTDLQAGNWSTPGNLTLSQVGTDAITGDPIMQAQVPVTSPKQFIRLNVTQP